MGANNYAPWLYLGNDGGRPAETGGNVVRENSIQGYGMEKHCVAAAPGVAMTRNTVERNTCAGLL